MDDDDRDASGEGILHPEGMRAARDLAAGIVHEVNNILGVIIGNAHLAKKNLGDVEALQKYVGEVRDAAEEGRELMRNLSILASSQSPRARALSLNDLLSNVVSGLGSAVELDVSVDDPVVVLDLWLAQDALSSLLRFMVATKTVTSIRIATRVLGSAAALTIEDDGASPSSEELRTLFTPFVKIDRRPKVELALTKLADLASRADGFITATVRQPHGLRIVLTLPVAEARASGDGPGVSLPKKGV
ncbi:MAG TPA: histidine kinase dimerization/phospho-acceptor domain-containing protein [Polyangiales bacterium]|nr:histidine kinase dimerization/phospho-acceptor domain-containing protein [Polyangiales bacterium]